MRNLNQMNITFTKHIKYTLLVLIIGLTSIRGFATNVVTITESISEIETARFAKAPPMVTLAKPSQKTMTTLKKRETIKAYVRNVRKKRHVVVRINGKRTRRFKFRKHNGLIKIKAKLDQGENLIEIVAKNRRGEASEFLSVTREQVAGEPTIDLIRPSDRMSTIENSILVTAQLQNVEHRDDIVVLVDGLERAFTYHASSGMIRAEINLSMGQNHIVINAYNRDGRKATAESWVNRVRRTAPNYNPTVSITAPTQQPFRTQEQSYLIKAIVRNIQDADQIDFVFNNETSYDFSYDSNKKEFMAYVNLREGSNVFRIKTANAYGNEQASGTIIHEYQNTYFDDEKSDLEPIVSFIHPNLQSTTTQANISVKASVQNITSRSQITIKYNGRIISNYLFSDGTYKYIEFEATNLRNGKNYINISVHNQDGQDKATAEVIYNKPTTRPIVSILSPTSNGQSTDVTHKLVFFKAKVLHANNQQIKVRVNGQEQAFKLSGSILTSKFGLRNGNNTISVIANNGKIAQATIIVNYQAIQKPTVTLSNLKGNIVTKDKSFTVQGKIEYVTNKNDIQVLVNNQVFTQYSFNAYTGSLTFTTPLRNGKNSIQVNATNDSGQVSNRSTIVYNDGVERFDGKK